MVLVSNEWQNKCEDVPKTTANTATTAGTHTTTEPTTSTSATITSASVASPSDSIPGTGNEKNCQSNSETVAGDITNSLTEAPIDSKKKIATGGEFPESATTTLNKTLANDNANNEQINKIIRDNSSIEIAYKSKFNEDDDIGECKIAQVGKLFTSAKKIKGEENLEESVLNYNNNLKIMAENTKESPIKEEKEEEELQSQTLINNQYAENNKDIDESTLYLNSNTNTLTTASITLSQREHNRQQSIIRKQQQDQQVPLSCPTTPNDLSSALQSALNATNNANNVNISVAAAGLQPNFLSQLALTANVAGLQKPTASSASILTAKQLNQSFNILDSNNQNKSDSNLMEATASKISVPGSTYDNNGQSKIVLICEENSHPFQTRTISLTPNVECMVGRLIAKSKASENNAIFDCKVLSRKHAVIWYTPDGKFWVKDTKSSNGTYINDNKLGDEDAELHFGDIVKFGVDVLENSRKEVHGCIIACVKLYMPDGREAISIESSTNRSQFSGKGRISYDELHRLNLYIQETSQREKVLTSKLCNIQNVLDATRKNSALCWQSMINEDQLLHRIHSLEKKLQFMEKNVPENVLRNEVLKLLDDKSSYQHTAKEALRKVYQERCDAMQMLSKMESAFAQSDIECSVLRDQIMYSKQTLQDVNTRLLRLETEYNDYKDEVTRQQQEAKDREEQRITELTEKLRERELECEDLKKKISELLIKRAELFEDEEQLLEKQAMEKLDAAIADMDLGDDEDSSDEDENDEVDVIKNDIKHVENNEDEKEKKETDIVKKCLDAKFVIKTKKPKTRPQLASIFGETFNGGNENQKQDICEDVDTSTHKSPPKRVKKTTIMKWLQNSDLNKSEGSFDIFKAICNENENDDDDSDGCGVLLEEESKDAKAMPDDLESNGTNLFSNFTSKLKNVQKNLKQLETEIQNETNKETSVENNLHVAEKSDNVEYESSDEDDAAADVKEGACAEEDFIVKSNGKACKQSVTQVLSSENKKYLLLKSSVNMLREAYNEIWDSVREQEGARWLEQSENHEERVKTRPLKAEVKTENQIPTTVTTRQLSNQINLCYSESDNTESDSEVESLTLSSPVNSSSATVVDLKANKSNDHDLLEQVKEYKSQVGTLSEKLMQTEMEAQHTLEIMQVECDDFKLKMENLNKIIETLKSEKKGLEEVINENQSKVQTFETKVCKENDTQLEKELELEEDTILNAINVSALEREEELITYKERLDEQERENIELRNEISLLKIKASTVSTKDLMLKQYLPCSVIILAIIIYFVTTYY